MKKLLVYLKDYKKESILGPLFKLLEASFELLVPLVVTKIIDVGIATGDVHYIVRMVLLMVGLALIGLICSITAQYFAAKAAVGFAAGLKSALFRHIQSLSYSEMDHLGTASLITRMTSDVNQLQSGVNLVLRLFLRSPFIVIGALIMAFSISPKLTLLFIGVTIMVSLIIWAIMRVTVPIYHEAQNGLDRVTLLTRENYVGARVVRAFARQADELAAFVETNDHLKKLQFAAGRISALMNPLTYLVVNLAVVALLLRGGVEVDAGKLTQGEVIALINYMSQILLSLLRLANLVVSVTRALASGMRVNEILNTHTTMQDPGTAELAVNDAAEAAKFEHVTFTYKDAGAPSLTDITFTARPGEPIGVIGGTGSGKSTLINLVCRFYDADNGSVALFGHDVKQYSFAQLRRLVGVVPQQAVLFTGTIRDNMQWAAPGASDEEIWQALEIAQAAEFVRGKPGMLDAPVETAGRNFSGGQRQRLTIARALVPKPKILILDEATSSVDTRTEVRIQKALDNLMRGRTSFIIAHRLSTIRNADLILVMKDGDIIEQGTHEQLLAQKGFYADLYNSQFEENA